MERTCRSWRKVVIAGNDDLSMPDVGSIGKGKRTNLWRDLALSGFPLLPSIVAALRDDDVNNNDESSIVANKARRGNPFSWKALYRSQFCATKCNARRIYLPKTSAKDYIFSHEFTRKSTGCRLFINSNRGLQTPSLWNQQVEDTTQEGFPYYEGPVDPRLVTHLGENPFSEENLKDVSVRIVVTRISDMKAVELAASKCLPNEPTELTHYTNFTDDKGNLVFCDLEYDEQFAPVVAERSEESWIIYVFLNCSSGRIRTVLEHRIVLESGHVEYHGYDDLKNEVFLEYLETQCPWPEN